jgi:hypothetical protein
MIARRLFRSRSVKSSEVSAGSFALPLNTNRPRQAKAAARLPHKVHLWLAQYSAAQPSSFVLLAAVSSLDNIILVTCHYEVYMSK